MTKWRKFKQRGHLFVSENMFSPVYEGATPAFLCQPAFWNKTKHIAAVSCTSGGPGSGRVGFGFWLTVKLGHAWVGAWVVHGWCMDGWCSDPCTPHIARQPKPKFDPTWPRPTGGTWYCCYKLIFLYVCIKILNKLAKNVKKIDVDHCLECAASKRWSTYKTGSGEFYYMKELVS